MSKLSVVIITLNEAKNIARCMSSVQAVADEIVVLDSFSTDETVAIAQTFGAKIFQKKFEGFTQQKNVASEKATYDFVFSIDADEAVSDELLQAIKREKEIGFGADGYAMNRLNFIGEREVRTCGLYPDTKIRIWNKAKGGWQGGFVHERMVMNQNARIKKLAGDLLHYSYKSTQELAAQNTRFAMLAAQSLQHESVVFLLLKLLLSAPFRFLKNYFLKLGFTDGLFGFSICVLQTTYVYEKYWRAIKLKYVKQ